MQFTNIRTYTEQWFTIALTLNSESIQLNIAEERRRQCKLHLYHISLFMAFRDVTSSSLHGCIIAGRKYFPRIELVIPYQPKDRTLLSLKRRESDMDCTHCVLHSRVRHHPSRGSDSPAGSPAGSQDSGFVSGSRGRNSIRNNNGQMEPHPHP